MRRKRLLHIVLAVGIIFTIGKFVTQARFFVAAQGPRLTYGETVNGEVTEPNEADTWGFDGLQGDVVEIRITRSDEAFLPVIVLLDPNKNLLVSLTWPDPSLAETSFVASLHTSGPHAISVTGRDNTIGHYALGIDLQQPDFQTASEGKILVYGRALDGAIDDDNYRENWSFHGTRGDIIDVSMQTTAGDLDPYVSLITPLGDTLLARGITDQPQTASLLAVKLPSTGVYTVVARRAGPNLGESGQTRGNYTLSLTLRQAGETDSAPTPFSITPGAQQPGRLTVDAPSSLYRLTGSGVLAITLEMSDPTRIGTASILGSNGVLLNTFSGVGILQASTTISSPNETLIEVSSVGLNPTTSADFMLTAHWLATEKRESRPLRYGIPQTARWLGNQQQAWYFSGHTGDLITLSLSPQGPVLNGTLQILGPDGDPLAQRAVQDTVLCQSLALENDGLYEVLFKPHATSGNYQIEVDLNGVHYRSFEQRFESQFAGIFPTDRTHAAVGQLASAVSDGWQLDITRIGLWRFEMIQNDSKSNAGLAIEDPEGTTLAVAVTDTFTRTAVIEIDLDHVGRYRVVAFDPTGEQPQAYSIYGYPNEGGVLAPDQLKKGVLTADDELDIWVINAPPESLITLDITVPEGGPIPVVNVIGPDGLLAASSQQSEEPNPLTIASGAGGDYRVFVAPPEAAQSRVIYHIFASTKVPVAWVPSQNLETAALSAYASETIAPLITPVPNPRSIDISKTITPYISSDDPVIQSARPAEFETLMRGVVTDAIPYQAWTFSVTAAQMLSFSVIALEDGAGPDITVIDQAGSVVAQKFEHDFTSAYLTHQFATGGNYGVVVRIDRGTHYTLWIETVTDIDGSVPVVLPGQVMAYGDTVYGELLGQILPTESYLFYGHADDQILAQVTRTEGNGFFEITLENAVGTILGQEDCPNTCMSADLHNVLLPADSVYRLTVTQSDGLETESGRYSLHLNLLSAQQSTERGGGVLNGPQTAVLSTSNSSHHWLFQAQAGERITVRVQPFEGRMPAPFAVEISDSAGHPFLRREGQLGQLELVLNDVILPRLGVYQIVITGGQRVQSSYRIDLARDTSALGDSGNILQYGETRGKTLTGTDFLDTWVFAGSQSDVVSVSVERIRGDDAFIGFQLRDKNGQVLGTTLSERGDSIARLEHVELGVTGHYAVVVGNPDESYQGETAYEITVTLEATHARSMGAVINYGETVRGTLFPDDSGDIWLFQGQQGDAVTITLSGDDATATPFITLIKADWQSESLNGQPAVQQSAQVIGEQGGRISVVLPSSGPYALEVENSKPAGGHYELQLDASLISVILHIRFEHHRLGRDQLAAQFQKRPGVSAVRPAMMFQLPYRPKAGPRSLLKWFYRTPTIIFFARPRVYPANPSRSLDAHSPQTGHTLLLLDDSWESMA